MCNPRFYLDTKKKQMTVHELNYLLFPVSINSNATAQSIMERKSSIVGGGE